jgi:hypothetical protein
MWYLALQRASQHKRRAVYGCKRNLKACTRHRSVPVGEGRAGGVGGGVGAEEIVEGGGVGDGLGVLRDRADGAEQDQRLRACTSAPAAVARSAGGTRNRARAVFGARWQNLDCLCVDKAAPATGGELQLVGEPVYRARIDGHDD